MRKRATLAAIALLIPVSAAAQDNASRPSIEAGVTIERFVSEYRFDNPSSLDTTNPVPHYFVQHYSAAQPWFVVDARYRIGRDAVQTTIGLAPQHAALGSDIDTFLDPGGDVATSGTSGDVRLSGFSIDQRVSIARVRGWTLGFGGRYTRRRADFLPADRVTTHSAPPSETSEFITTREFTTSDEIRLGVRADKTWDAGGGWRVEAGGVVWPIVRGRLGTELPDKYAGQDIVFDAFSFGGEARASLIRRVGAAHVTLSGQAGGLLPFVQSASLRQHTAAAGIAIVFGGTR